MITVHLIYNPTSGKGAANAAFAKIKNWVDTQKDIKLVAHPTENAGHASIIARDLTSGDEVVNLFVMGGDGTLNEVLNGIVNFAKTKMAVLPFGSGNDFAFALNLGSNDPVELFHAYVRNPKERLVDYLIINNKYKVINAVGIGLSAEVINCRDKMKHFKPSTQYTIATIRKSLFWKAISYTMQLDDKAPQSIETMWMTINNGRRVGSNVITSTSSKLDDGLASITYLQRFSHLKTLHYLSKIKKGLIEKLKPSKCATAKKVTIDLSDACIEYDGNLLKHQNHIVVEVVPSKLHLLVTK